MKSINVQAKHEMTVADLLNELKWLLGEHFVATQKEDNNGLVLRFLDGKRFRFTVEEVK